MTPCHEDITSHKAELRSFDILRPCQTRCLCIKSGRILPRSSKFKRLVFLRVRVESLTSLLHLYATLGGTEPSAFGDMVAVFLDDLPK